MDVATEALLQVMAVALSALMVIVVTAILIVDDPERREMKRLKMQLKILRAEGRL